MFTAPALALWYTKSYIRKVEAIFLSNSMKKITTSILAGLLSLPLVASAVTLPGTAGPTGAASQLPTGIKNFNGFLSVFDTLILWLFTILLVLAVFFIIMAAFKYLTAGGDEEKIGNAHQLIIYAVVAIGVAFLAQGISFVVGQLLNTGGAGVVGA